MFGKVLLSKHKKLISVFLMPPSFFLSLFCSFNINLPLFYCFNIIIILFFIPVKNITLFVCKNYSILQLFPGVESFFYLVLPTAMIICLCGENNSKQTGFT